MSLLPCLPCERLACSLFWHLPFAGCVALVTQCSCSYGGQSTGPSLLASQDGLGVAASGAAGSVWGLEGCLRPHSGVLFVGLSPAAPSILGIGNPSSFQPPF